jgi:hypothetical protein
LSGRHDLPFHPLAAFVGTVERATPLFPERITAEHADAGAGMFGRLVLVPKEHKIAAAGRAVDFRLSSNRVPACLVQQLSTAVTLLGDVQSLRADSGEFGSGELHTRT